MKQDELKKCLTCCKQKCTCDDCSSDDKYKYHCWEIKEKVGVFVKCCCSICHIEITTKLATIENAAKWNMR